MDRGCCEQQLAIAFAGLWRLLGLQHRAVDRRGARRGDQPAATGWTTSVAISTTAAYRDFEAEFDFSWDMQGSDSGFVFRGRHARHYYLVHFPCTGQQYRGAHFWAAISKVDASGWARVLRTEIVPGIPSEMCLWHTARLRVQGPEIRLWVDGRAFPVVTDDTYDEPGYVGLETYNGRDPDEVKEFFGDAPRARGLGQQLPQRPRSR